MKIDSKGALIMNIQRMRNEYELGLRLTNAEFINSLFNDIMLKESYFKSYKNNIMCFCIFRVEDKNIEVYHNLFSVSRSIFYAYDKSYSALEFIDLLFSNLSEDKQEYYADSYIQASYFEKTFLEQIFEWIKNKTIHKTFEFLEQELIIKKISVNSSKKYQAEIELNLNGATRTYVIKSIGTIKEIKFFLKEDRSNKSLTSSLLQDLEYKYRDKNLAFPFYAFGNCYESIIFSLLRDLIITEYKKNG